MHKPWRLDAADLDGVRSFRTFCDLEAYLVTFLEFVELNVGEFVGVEKEIFFATFNFDEPEAFVSETSDSSFLHGNGKNFVIASRQGTGVEARSYFRWIRPG